MLITSDHFQEPENYLRLSLYLYADISIVTESINELLVEEYEIAMHSYNEGDYQKWHKKIVELYIPLSQLRESYRHAILGEPDPKRVLFGFFKSLNVGYADEIVELYYCGVRLRNE